MKKNIKKIYFISEIFIFLLMTFILAYFTKFFLYQNLEKVLLFKKIAQPSKASYFQIDKFEKFAPKFGISLEKGNSENGQ